MGRKGFEMPDRTVSCGLHRSFEPAFIRFWTSSPDAKRDWGYAKDYVEDMWRRLQAEQPDTYVLASNSTETVRDFVTMAAKGAGITLEWQGQLEQECGIDIATGKAVLGVNPKFYRRAEVELLIVNPANAKAKLSCGNRSPRWNNFAPCW